MQVVDLHKSFGGQPVLRGVDLTIATGKVTVIIGGSGSGKSVLVKHLVGLLRPDSGQVKLHGQDLFAMPPDALLKARRQFGMLFQAGGQTYRFSASHNSRALLYGRADAWLCGIFHGPVPAAVCQIASSSCWARIGGRGARGTARAISRAGRITAAVAGHAGAGGR